MSKSFRIIEAPQPVKPGKARTGIIITDVTELFNSSVSLYASTRIRQHENPHAIISNNTNKFINPDRWRVSMEAETDRCAIRQFKSVPLNILLDFWKKPINIIESEMNPVGNGIFKFNNASYFNGSSLTCFFLWPEVSSEPQGPVVGKNEPLVVEDTIKWMVKNSPEIIPFTDNNSIFLDSQVEIAYISDLMG